MDIIADARSFLFVPGSVPDRFRKARNSHCDLVILDLEDAVPPSDKPRARRAVSNHLVGGGAGPVVVRVNAIGTEWFDADVAAANHPDVIAIMLPRAESGAPLEQVARVKPIIALLETARGLEDMRAIARTDGVVRLSIGALDLCLDLDVSPDAAVLDPVLLQMTVASRAAGLAAPVAPVTPSLDDAAALARDVAHTRDLGFTGKLCIHPKQIEITHRALRPGTADIDAARRIVAAAAASGGAAVALDGKMIDRPVIDRARRLLERAAR